jgi:putative NIF3 family GTP cyclohydrolase 1 type 2
VTRIPSTRWPRHKIDGPYGRRDDIVAFANELLDVQAFPEYGLPGLQVVGADEVSKLACGVSSSRELFERAGAAGAQLVLVHHGLFWRNEPLVVDRRLKGRLADEFALEWEFLDLASPV